MSVLASAAMLLGASIEARAQSTLTTLHYFDGSSGADPLAGLELGEDGNFYGSTNTGGMTGYGTVFKVSPGGTLTTLHSFRVSDGERPAAELVRGADGSFYGTTEHGGSGGYGTVFRITPGGTLTTLHSFSSLDGASPLGKLTQAPDGSLYGTTYGGGMTGHGVIFRITTSGQFSVVHSFEGSDVYPYAGLVLGADGSMYGTTIRTIYKITLGGVFTRLYTFSEYVYPNQLALGLDGNFYGTTEVGGANAKGSIFKIAPDGTLTPLYSFGDYDGARPRAGLTRGTDGNFYGTTSLGGSFSGNGGTVFRFTPSGALTTLHSFTDKPPNTDGHNPISTALQGPDGFLYGTTYSGGAPPGRRGTVFRLSINGSSIGAPTNLTVVPGNSSATLSWSAVPGATSYNIYQGTTPAFVSTVPIVSGIAGLTFQRTGLTNGTTYFFRVAGVAAGSIGPNSVEVSATPAGVTAATPTFSPAGGSYSTSQNVTLATSTSGATIYFTTDGSTPSSSSQAYSGQIAVTSTTTIRAVAVAAGYTNSQVTSVTYVIGTGSGGTGGTGGGGGSLGVVGLIALMVLKVLRLPLKTSRRRRLLQFDRTPDAAVQW